MAKIFRHRLPAALVVFTLAISVAPPALADAEVTVELRDADGGAADGDVTLVDKQGAVKASCTTAEGKCQMSGVAGGSYMVKVVPKQGKPPKPRKVMIPPSGKVSLIVSATAK